MARRVGRHAAIFVGVPARRDRRDLAARGAPARRSFTGDPSGDTGVYVWNSGSSSTSGDKAGCPSTRRRSFGHAGRGAGQSQPPQLHDVRQRPRLAAACGWSASSRRSTSSSSSTSRSPATRCYLLARELTATRRRVAGSPASPSRCRRSLIARGAAHFSLVAAAPLPIFALCCVPSSARPAWSHACALGAVVAVGHLFGRLLRRLLPADGGRQPRRAVRPRRARRRRARARPPACGRFDVLISDDRRLRRRDRAPRRRRDRSLRHPRRRPHALHADAAPDDPRPRRAVLSDPAAAVAAKRAEPACASRMVAAGAVVMLVMLSPVLYALGDHVLSGNADMSPPLLAQQPARRRPARLRGAQPEPRLGRRHARRWLDRERPPGVVPKPSARCRSSRSRSSPVVVVALRGGGRRASVSASPSSSPCSRSARSLHRRRQHADPDAVERAPLRAGPRPGAIAGPLRGRWRRWRSRCSSRRRSRTSAAAAPDRRRRCSLVVGVLLAIELVPGPRTLVSAAIPGALPDHRPRPAAGRPRARAAGRRARRHRLDRQLQRAHAVLPDAARQGDHRRLSVARLAERRRDGQPRARPERADDAERRPGPHRRSRTGGRADARDEFLRRIAPRLRGGRRDARLAGARRASPIDLLGLTLVSREGPLALYVPRVPPPPDR